MNVLATILIGVSLLFAMPAYSDESLDELDITMTILDGETAPEETLGNRIALPGFVPDVARDEAQAGIDNANQARQHGSDNANERAGQGGRGNSRAPDFAPRPE